MTRARTHMCHSSYHPWKWALHWGGSNTGSNHTQCGHKAKPIRSMLIHFCWSSQMWSFARLHANTVVSKHELLLQLPSWIQDTAPEGTKEMAGHKWTGKKQKPLGSKSMVVTLTKGVFTVGQQVSPHLRCRPPNLPAQSSSFPPILRLHIPDTSQSCLGLWQERFLRPWLWCPNQDCPNQLACAQAHTLPCGGSSLPGAMLSSCRGLKGIGRVCNDVLASPQR